MNENNVQVLLIEDNREYAWMLQLILSEIKTANFELTHVSTLKDALSILNSDRFDVILLDLALPDSHGFNTFNDIYTHFPQIPIVVITALDDKELALRAVREGAQDFLVKGEMEVSQLVKSLQFAVERHHSIENLRRLSMIDELTGLLNRRGFLSLGMQQIKIAQRVQRDMLLFFADLDGLKQINDQFGHHEGDLALKNIASILTETFRSSDLVARLGGDEFTILAIDAPSDNAQAMLARLRETIKKHNAALHDYQLSLSIGVARFDSQNSTIDLDEVLAQADKELYEHKRSKRDLKTSS